MTLPLPNLDDRRFQDLVDDAKRMVQQQCPEWSDHNVSDPGVTLIETFAFMVDELLYRLNRVPDRLYITFLDLLGVTLHPPTAAHVDLTAWLSAPQDEPVTLPARSEAGTLRTDRNEAILFATTRDLVIPPRHLVAVRTLGAGEAPSVSRDDELGTGADVPVFSQPPVLDDVLMLGLDDAAPSCAVALRFDCKAHGVGVDPLWPPLVWEAWDGSGWSACEVGRDDTGGLNRPGDVVLHVPESHQASLVDQVRAGWLRCRVVPALEGYPFYSASPTISEASAFTIGGTVPALHAETVTDEVLGLSEGVPGQSFRLARGPVVADGTPFTVEVAGGAGWETWTEVTSFAGCDADDRVLRLDRSTGEVLFGPAVREPDGALRRYGAVPPKGAPLRLPSYRTGGGPHGNVAAGTIMVLRSTTPLVDRIENRRAAIGGVAAETIDEARTRGPLALRTRDRAVTPEDYEQLARNAAPGIARVRCRPATSSGEAGGLRVLLVPSASADEDGTLRFEDLVPSPEVLEAVAGHLDERRTAGARVVVEPPSYQGVTVVATLVARPRTSSTELERHARLALNRYFDPLVGGLDGQGWPFGRPVQAGEVYAVLQRLPGTELVDAVKLYAADPLTGKRGEATQRIDLDPFALVFSYLHQIRVVRGQLTMRGSIPGLVTPVPVLQRLPGVLQDDPFMQRFVTAFDEGLAPVIATLDGLAGYVDPWLAPPDFLDWLAGWVGLDELDDAWSLDQRRAVVAGAALVHRQRGTVRGVQEALRLMFDAKVEVEDSGGCTWSERPGTDPPGEERPSIHVRMVVADPGSVDTRRIDAAIEAVKPAHVAHSFELLAAGEPPEAAGP